MGNQASRNTTPTHSSPQSQWPNSTSNNNTSVTPSHGRIQNDGGGDGEQRFHLHEKLGHNPNPKPRRRESIQALSTAKASAAPPSASLESATSSRRPHRARSQTISASITSSSSTTAHVANTLRAAAQDTDRMGNEQSRQKQHHHQQQHHQQQHHHHHHSHSHSHSPSHTQSHAASPTPPKPSPPTTTTTLINVTSPPTRPVDVPAAPRDDTTVTRTEAAASLEPADGSLIIDMEGPIVPSSHYSRPPRLPLPIEEEPHTPGSPIIYSSDSPGPIIDPAEGDNVFPRRGSMLSTTTADDDDLGDEYKAPQGQETIPTLIEWEGPGDSVYVTGTFAGWNRKYRLHRNGPSKNKNALSAYVHITPGTHHLMFIVDNDMKTSDKLPTAVDYTNILVNYIEVVRNEPEEPPAAVPAKKPAPAPADLPSQSAPAPPDPQPLKKPVPEPKPKVPPPAPKKYHSEIPRYLLDLDAPEESKRFRRANEVQGVMPNPPTLPMFLNKSILNGVTPMKDDSSVLIMPNHTVLNHLATSSIKDNILATSATTRYKQKFLTTIMYKPRAEEHDQI